MYSGGVVLVSHAVISGAVPLGVTGMEVCSEEMSLFDFVPFSVSKII